VKLKTSRTSRVEINKIFNLCPWALERSRVKKILPHGTTLPLLWKITKNAFSPNFAKKITMVAYNIRIGLVSCH
jgi:hypothetical protein